MGRNHTGNAPKRRENTNVIERSSTTRRMEQCKRTEDNKYFIVRGRPSFCPKGGLPVPNNKFHIAFGDAYCIACIGTTDLAKMNTKSGKTKIN